MRFSFHIKKPSVGIIFLILWAVVSFQTVYASDLPKGFVYLHQVDPTIVQKMEFSTNENFVGVKVEGYEGNQIICTQKAAEALKKVQQSLKAKYPTYCLQVMDAYRPAKSVRHIYRWVTNLKDQATKDKYYPDVDKKMLRKFMASKRSPHSRGSTVDVAIINEMSRKSLDYGPKKFGEASHTHYPGLSPTQRENRVMLRNLMMSQGFVPLKTEFWHFTLKDEPFPNTYFDFDIRNEGTDTLLQSLSCEKKVK